MRSKGYSESVSALLGFAPPGIGPLGQIPAADLDFYRKLPFGPAHELELIAMATDKQLSQAPEPRCYARIHAWRVLSLQQSAAAVQPLLNYLEFAAKMDDDWALEEIPMVLAAIGPAALPGMKRAFPDQRRSEHSRLAISCGMVSLARQHDSARAEVVDALCQQLQRAAFYDESFNGCLVAQLLDLQAVEAAELIIQVYETGLVDEKFCGPLEAVLDRLGLELDRSDDSIIPQPAPESTLQPSSPPPPLSP